MHNAAIHRALYSVSIEYGVSTVALCFVSEKCSVSTIDASITKAIHVALYSVSIEYGVSTVALCFVSIKHGALRIKGSLDVEYSARYVDFHIDASLMYLHSVFDILCRTSALDIELRALWM